MTASRPEHESEIAEWDKWLRDTMPDAEVTPGGVHFENQSFYWRVDFADGENRLFYVTELTLERSGQRIREELVRTSFEDELRAAGSRGLMVKKDGVASWSPQD